MLMQLPSDPARGRYINQSVKSPRVLIFQKVSVMPRIRARFPGAQASLQNGLTIFKEEQSD